MGAFFEDRLVVTAACLFCDKPFAFDPRYVPMRAGLSGEQEPICKTCYEEIRADQAAEGEQPWPAVDAKAWG
jgi:hypothetical protein